MTLFRNKYRIESARLKGWDYTTAGWYFVTICTQGHQPWLGEVSEGDIHLSPIGEIVAEEWLRTPRVRHDIALDEWIIMPDHVHGIIIITDSPGVETPRRGVSTPSRLHPHSLGAVIGQIKSICTKRIWAAGHPEFGWQARFYDRIIRDEAALHRIRQYIRNNPAKWAMDQNRGEGVWQ